MCVPIAWGAVWRKLSLERGDFWQLFEDFSDSIGCTAWVGGLRGVNPRLRQPQLEGGHGFAIEGGSVAASVATSAWSVDVEFFLLGHGYSPFVV